MTDAFFCTCCGKKLNPAKIVMLELDQRNHTYHDFNDVPEEWSQGGFPFGSACANKQRKEAKAARETA